MRKPYSTCAICSTGTRKADTFTCDQCRQKLCPQHTYFYYDSSNEVISRNSPPLCATCYKKRHP